MKSLIVVGFCTLLCCRSVLSATHYVDIASTNPVSPYTNWVTAATNIQDAVDEAVNGETVLVSDGYHLLSSEITVTNSITLQSINGPETTIVDGHAGNRCFNLGASGCLVAGFSITGGFTTERGGGLYCQNITAVVSNCTVDVNYSDVAGGGIENWGTLTLNNCGVSGNVASGYGGGIPRLLPGDARRDRVHAEAIFRAATTRLGKLSADPMGFRRLGAVLIC